MLCWQPVFESRSPVDDLPLSPQCLRFFFPMLFFDSFFFNLKCVLTNNRKILKETAKMVTKTNELATKIFGFSGQHKKVNFDP